MSQADALAELLDQPARNQSITEIKMPRAQQPMDQADEALAAIGIKTKRTRKRTELPTQYGPGQPINELTHEELIGAINDTRTLIQDAKDAPRLIKALLVELDKRTGR